MKNIYAQYGLIIVSVLLMSVVWEFWLEDLLDPLSTQEVFQVKVEYVLTVLVFSSLTLIIPMFMSIRHEKRRHEIELDRENTIAELDKTLKEIRRLEGIIPICSYCKKIRNEEGAWSQMEKYIQENSGAAFSHGICPQCHAEQLEKVIYQAIDDLPDELKVAVTLREFEGLSYEEIAEVMECPVGTVRSRIFRARESIEKKIAAIG